MKTPHSLWIFHIKSLQNATHPHMLRISSLIANDSQTDTYRAPKMTRRSQRAYRQANWTLRHTLAVWSALENVVVSVKVSETESILVSKTNSCCTVAIRSVEIILVLD